MATFIPVSRIHAAHRYQHLPAPGAAAWTAIVGALQQFAQRRAQALHDRRGVQALMQLDDDQLRDIGMTRGQVESFIGERSRLRAAKRSTAPTR